MKQTLALAAALATVPLSAHADDANFVNVQYRAQQQVSVSCGVGLFCSVSFAPGEVLGSFFNSNPGAFQAHETYSANRLTPRPQLVFESAQPGLRANFIAMARNSDRVYYLMLTSTNDTRPTYVIERYEDERKNTPKPQPAPPKPRPAQPPTLSQVMDRACATQRWAYTADSDRDRHGNVDPVLHAIRPARICGDQGHLFLQMPRADVAVSDLPIVLEDTPSGETQTNSHYFENERMFVVNSSSDVVLKLTVGKRIAQIHVKRVSHG